jgi:hypothetical protein
MEKKIALRKPQKDGLQEMVSIPPDHHQNHPCSFPISLSFQNSHKKKNPQ